MKSIFCLLLLPIFFAMPGAFAASIVLKPATPPTAFKLRAEIAISPAGAIAGPTVPWLIGETGQSRSPGSSVIPATKPQTSVADRRYTFRERLIFKYLQKQLKKLGMREGEPADPRRLRLGRLALIFGAGAFVVALIPILQILSPLMAIAGIVLGIASLKGNSNIPGILGICFGGAFLLLILLVVAIFVLTLSFW